MDISCPWSAELADTVITTLKNGPYHVNGSFSVMTENGTVLHREGETWLCRCGGSQSKPFCDGTHNTNGFFNDPDETAHNDSGDAYLAVAQADAVEEGEILGVEVAGKQVVIGRVKGEICAIGGICSHQFARLAEGELDGETVLCPLHNSGFNIRTGEPVRLPAEAPVPTYDVKIENGQVLVARDPKS